MINPLSASHSAQWLQVQGQQATVKPSAASAQTFASSNKSVHVPASVSKAYAMGGASAIRFSGADEASDSGVYRLQDEKKLLKEAEEQKSKAQSVYSRWQKRLNVLYGAPGTLAGGSAGLMGTAVTLGGDLGSLTAGGAYGGFALGRRIGQAIHSKSLREAEENLAQALSKYNLHEERVKQPILDMADMDDLVKQAKEREDKSDLSFIDWNQIKQYRAARCLDVRAHLKNSFNPRMIAELPAYAQEYKANVGKLDDLVEQMDKQVSIILGPSRMSGNDPASKAEAVKILHRLEGEYRNGKEKPQSKEFFRTVLNSPDSHDQVVSAILQEMTRFPELRPEPNVLKSMLEGGLRTFSNNTGIEKQLALLQLTQAAALPSSTINFNLNCMIRSRDVEESVKEQAKQLLAERAETGLYREIKPDEVATTVANAMVGNPRLRDHMLSMIDGYALKVMDPNRKLPALTMWVEGEPGIGKTLLVRQLHQTLHGVGDNEGMVHIDFQPGTTLSDVVTRLKEASPLQGKTIFFDEFQQLGSLDKKDLDDVMALLKLMLSPDLVDGKKVHDDYGLDLGGTVLAFAANESYSDIAPLNRTKTGRSLRDRLVLAKDIRLTQNLRPYAGQIIEQLGPKQLYLKEHPDLGVQVSLAPEAVAFLTEQVQQRLPKNPKQTVSGRTIVSLAVGELKEALALAKYTQNRTVSLDSQGHANEPLHFTVSDGQLVLAPPEAAKPASKK